MSNFRMKTTPPKRKVPWKIDLVNKVQIPAVDYFCKAFNKNGKKEFKASKTKLGNKPHIPSLIRKGQYSSVHGQYIIFWSQLGCKLTLTMHYQEIQNLTLANHITS